MIFAPEFPAVFRTMLPPTSAGGSHLPADVAVSTGVPAGAALHVGLTMIAIVAVASGLHLAGPAAMIGSCLVISLLGLPHGALDMVTLIDLAPPARWRAIALYLGAAGVMAGLWWALPSAALLLFLATAIVHFSEDWAGPGPIAGGGALGLLAAPALFHHAEVGALFAILAGGSSRFPVADALLMLSPVAVAAGLTACALSWHGAMRLMAVSSLAALAGMLFLPPLLGFALSFGLFHSPRHFNGALRALDRSRGWRVPVLGASVAALAMVVFIAWARGNQGLPSGVIRGTFIILSVLTVPHMALPMIVRRIKRR